MIPAWIATLEESRQPEAFDDWNERSAIMQYCGNMSRDDAELRAGELLHAHYVAQLEFPL